MVPNGLVSDTGTGAFIDANAAEHLDGKVDKLQDSWADDPTSWKQDHIVGKNEMVVFGTGLGDGAYPVWVGRDARGNVARVVADLTAIRYDIP